jgi:hypothetical protein
VKIQRHLCCAYLIVGIVSLALLAAPLAAAQGKGKGSSGQQSQNQDITQSSVTAAPSDAVHDVMTVTFESRDGCSIQDAQDPENWNTIDVKALATEAQLIRENQPLGHLSGTQLAILITERCPECGKTLKAAAGIKKSDTAYVFHLTEWSNRTKGIKATFVPISSDWHVYQQSDLDTLKFTGFHSDGSPRMFNKKDVIVVGIDHYRDAIDLTSFASVYNTTATQGTPQNQTDLIALISALAGMSSPLKGQTGKSIVNCQFFVAAGMQHGTAHLPFDTKVVVASGNPSDVEQPGDSRNSDAAKDRTGSSPQPALQRDISSAGASCTSDSTNCADLRLPGNTATVTVMISGTFSGNMVFEVGKGGSFTAAEAFVQDQTDKVTSVNAPGTWTVLTAGQSDVRVRAQQWNSGTAKISMSTGIADDPKSDPPANGGSKQNAKGPTQPAAPGVVSCTGTLNSAPCTSTRTFTSEDPEWWDVSIGIAIPGVRESKYSIVNNQLTKNVTTHTDFYGMVDLYPFFMQMDKNDWAPHINVGVPIASQSLYRPYFGLGESVGGLLSRISGPKRLLKLPLDINFFGGMVWMKTTYLTDSPTTTSALSADSHRTRVWKPIFGIEVPVSSIASKIKGAGSKNTNGSGKTTNSGSGGS